MSKANGQMEIVQMGAEFTCPQCTLPAHELFNGVCAGCKRTNERVHAKKLRTAVRWTARDFRIQTADGGHRPPLKEEAVMDESDAQAVDLASATAKVLDLVKCGFRRMLNYKGDPVLAMSCLALALGWSDVIGGATEATELAVRLYHDPRKKAAVTKCLVGFQDAVGIPPGPGQRSDNGRKQMAASRRNQLSPQNTQNTRKI